MKHPLTPHAVVLPHSLFPPVGPLPRVELPADAFPKRLGSHELDIYDIDTRPIDSLMRELMAKLEDESARLRRLLPAPPAAYRWEGEAQASNVVSLDAMWGDVTVRLVYRLREVGDVRA